MQLHDFLSVLKKVRKTPTGWSACCPAHDDQNPSLSIRQADNGRILLRCHAGCSYKSILAKLVNLSASENPSTPPRQRNLVKTYDYVDARGNLIYQVCRYEPKTFRQRRPDGRGGWIWNIKGIQPILYRLPEVIRAKAAGEVIWIVEGEKDADHLVSLGLCATCNSGGAAKWHCSFNEFLEGAACIVIADKDEPGRKHATQVCDSLRGVARSIRINELPDRGCKVKDATDWINAGGTVEELKLLVDDLQNQKNVRRQTSGIPSESVGAKESPFLLAQSGRPLESSDLGLAERFAFYNMNKAIFVSDAGMWSFWDGRRWIADPQQVVIRRLMAETVRTLPHEASELPASCGDKKRMAHFKYALKSEANERINAAIKLAPSIDMAKHSSAFDANPMLLNVSNGTIDLRSGSLLPHDRLHLMTRLSPVRFEKDAYCEMFDRFLRDLTCGDDELAGYLQRAVAYSLTGMTGEKCIFIVYSEMTDTGKTTFLEGLQTVAGDYAMTLDLETLLRRELGSGPHYDLAKLQGIRIAVASEASDDGQFDAALIKRLTGGDTIRAREIRQSSISFAPTHKIWIGTNIVPGLANGGDEAIWNRLKRVPFNHAIPREMRDPRIKAALGDPESEMCRAFLAWAVRGCSQWQATGIGSCSAVERSTASYREEANPLADFIEDCCIMDAAASIPAGIIREQYTCWCRQNGIRVPLSRREFARCLRKMGACDVRGTAGKRLWNGIRVKSDGSGASGVTSGNGFESEISR